MINGVLGNILTGESFYPVSQTYYFGKVGKTAPRQTILVEGAFVDTRTDLDASAAYTSQHGKRGRQGRGALLSQVAFARKIREICPGKEHTQLKRGEPMSTVYPPLDECRRAFEGENARRHQLD